MSNQESMARGSFKPRRMVNPFQPSKQQTVDITVSKGVAAATQ